MGEGRVEDGGSNDDFRLGWGLRGRDEGDGIGVLRGKIERLS